MRPPETTRMISCANGMLQALEQDTEGGVAQPDEQHEPRLALPEHSAVGRRRRSARRRPHEERADGDEERQDHRPREHAAGADGAGEPAREIADADPPREQGHPAERLDLGDLLVGARDLDAEGVRHHVLQHEAHGDQHHRGQVSAPAVDRGGQEPVSDERDERAQQEI